MRRKGSRLIRRKKRRESGDPAADRLAKSLGRQIAAGARLDRAGMVAMRRRHGPLRRRRARQIPARAATPNIGSGRAKHGLA